MRIVRRAGIIALGGFAVYLGLVARFIVFPPEDALPAKADVILVLGPANWHRTVMARDLVRRGIAKNVLISVPSAARTPGSEDYRRFHDCPSQAGAATYCDYADPHTTRQTAHLERARMIIGRCFPGAVTMHASGEEAEQGWLYQVAYQTAATAKAWILRSC